MLNPNIWDSSSLVLSIKSYEPKKICLIREIGGKYSLKVQAILMKMISSYSVYQRTLLKKFQALIYKNVEFYHFCQKTDHGCVLFFPRGWSYWNNSHGRLEEVASERKLKVLVYFFSEQKEWRTTDSPPTPIFSPKFYDQKFEIAILFSIVERANNYVFRDKMTPKVRGERPVTWNLPSVYV